MSRPAAENQGATLAGLHVLVTRPAAQAQALCAAIEARGGNALRLPLMEMTPAGERAAIDVRLHAGIDDAWVFTSTNAVRFAGAIDPAAWPAVVAAAGPATAAALRASGCAQALIPQIADGAPGVLALPAFADPPGLRGLRVLIVGGEAPLPELADGLLARGAQVESLAVYRREPVAHAPAAAQQAVAQVQAIVVASGESLIQLHRLAEGAALRARQLVVPSARVVELARALRFDHEARCAPRVSDAGFVSTLEDWWSGRRTTANDTRA